MIRQEEHQMKGEIHIGTLTGLGKSWISARVIEFMHKYPDLNINITLDFPEHLLKKFERGVIDVLVLPDHLLPAYAERWDLEEESCSLVFPRSFPINSDISMKDLLQHPLIMFESNDPLFYLWCKGHYKVTPRQVKPRFVVNSFGQMLQAVEAGLGMAVVPTHVFRRWHHREELQVLKNATIDSGKVSFGHRSEMSEFTKITELYAFLKKASDEFQSRRTIS
jgi:DNA-binding transcriptional LysR family regulator